MERGTIRIVVPNLVFQRIAATKFALAAEIIREFDQWLKKNVGHVPGLLSFAIPTTRDRLLSNLRDAYAEFTAGKLTITPERLKLFDFTLP